MYVYIYNIGSVEPDQTNICVREVAREGRYGVQRDRRSGEKKQRRKGRAQEEVVRRIVGVGATQRKSLSLSTRAIP